RALHFAGKRRNVRVWSPLRSLVGWEGSRGQGPVPRIHVDEEEAELRLGRVLRDCLAEPWRQKQEILFLCIGTDRSTGDALGPLAGSQLAAVTEHPPQPELGL